MKNTSLKTGWQWVQEGFSLFRQQPGNLFRLFSGYLFLLLAINLIPIVGLVAPIVLIPFFSMTFMEACACIEHKQPVSLNLLFTAFRSPARIQLLQLGILYTIIIAGVLLASQWVDEGLFWKLISGQIAITDLDQETLKNSHLSLAMLFSGLLYLPAIMGFWYAAPLIAWKNMSTSKAIFYSFFAVYHARGAFTIYGIAWSILGVLLPSIVAILVLLLIQQPVLAIMIMVPFSVTLTLIMYCSFYPTYTQIFHDTP